MIGRMNSPVLIRSTRAPTKDRLIGKIRGGSPVFRGTRVPVHMLAELVPSRAGARSATGGEVLCTKRRGSRWPAPRGGRARRNAIADMICYPWASSWATRKIDIDEFPSWLLCPF